LGGRRDRRGREKVLKKVEKKKVSEKKRGKKSQEMVVVKKEKAFVSSIQGATFSRILKRTVAVKNKGFQLGPGAGDQRVGATRGGAARR